MKAKAKVGNKIYDGEKEPVMVILSDDEKELIAKDNHDFTIEQMDKEVEEVIAKALFLPDE